MALGRKVGLLRDGLRTENLSQLVPGAINSISDVAQDAIQGAVDVQEQLGLVRYFLLNGRNTLTLHVLDLHLSNTVPNNEATLYVIGVACVAISCPSTSCFIAFSKSHRRPVSSSDNTPTFQGPNNSAWPFKRPRLLYRVNL